MSTLILLRHGQASFGAERYDALSGLGRLQAEAVGRHFGARAEAFRRIWIGPRERHRLTARHAIEPLGLDWQQAAEPALNEFAEGQEILAAAERRQNVRLRGEGAMSGREARRRYSLEIEAWAEGRSQIEGVPDARAFRVRIADWLQRACADPAPGQTVLAVTSGGVIAAVIAEILDLPDASLAANMGVLHNGSLTRIAFSSGRRQIGRAHV
jgi:broad specificity phosphatase PhoE